MDAELTAPQQDLFAEAVEHARNGSYQRALILFQQLLEVCPLEHAIHNNYAYVLEKLGYHAEAEAEYRSLFEQMPGYVNGALGYAGTLEKRKKYMAAADVLRHAVITAPDDPKLLSGLGNSLIMAGDAEAALLWYGLSLEINQWDRTTASNFLYTLLMVAEIQPRVVAKELEAVAFCPALAFRISRIYPHLRHITSEFLVRMHRHFGKLLGVNTSSLQCTAIVQAERIKVGYVSADLYSHPVGYFLEGVIPLHDRNRFEIFVFSPYSERDGLTAKLKNSAEHWVELNDADHSGALRQIRKCALNIAVDMAGHTGGNYLDLFAQGLAPVQISWGGYPGTTGLECMNYIIADRVALPPEDIQYYTERPIYLSHGYVSFIPPGDAEVPGDLPALSSGFITFGSFNTVQKLNSRTLALWGAVLRALPESRLLLKAKGFDDHLVCNMFIEKLAEEGVSPERLTLEGHSPRNELLTAYQRVDIALDPVPYQGGITVLEALWMGVPTLVLKGNRPPFIRHAESHLMRSGLGDWIAASEEEYVSKAIVCSNNLHILSNLRKCLRQQMAVSSICNADGFTRELEGAYEIIQGEHILKS